MSSLSYVNELCMDSEKYLLYFRIFGYLLGFYFYFLKVSCNFKGYYPFTIITKQWSFRMLCSSPLNLPHTQQLYSLPAGISSQRNLRTLGATRISEWPSSSSRESHWGAASDPPCAEGNTSHAQRCHYWVILGWRAELPHPPPNFRYDVKFYLTPPSPAPKIFF